MEQVLDLAPAGYQQRGIARIISIQRAVAMHDDMVPGPVDQRLLLRKVVIQALSTDRLDADVVFESGLLSEKLEQCG